ncbi:AEC family transporter [Microgenomates group bacterium]|nr:AEC family transporter [Microgenomates group bacterium]
MDIALFYSKLAAVGLIIALGFLLAKLKIISAETNKHLIDILLTVAWPCAIFIAFPQQFDPTTFHRFLTGLIGGTLVLLAMIFVSHLLFNKKLLKTSLATEGRFAFVFNNASFLGYPLVMTMFGPSALMPYCGFILVFNIALFSYGVFLFKRRLDAELIKGIIINPNIIAVFAGLIFFLFSIPMPAVINDSLSLLGAVMTPLSLLCIGYMLSQAPLVHLIHQGRLFLIALAQLILAPTLTFFILSALRIDPEIRSILVLIQALPTATSLGLFAKKYGGNTLEASELVAISTALSVITLPLLMGIFLK